MKTIKQIADELGVSKETIRKQVPNLPPNTVTTSANRTTLINSTGEAIIKTLVTSGVPNKTTKPTRLSPTETTENNRLYDILQAELDSKNRQIDTLLEQLAEKDRQLHAAQALHAGTIQQQLTASGGEQLAADELEAESSDSTNSHEKPRFWSGIFGKKRGKTNNV